MATYPDVCPAGHPAGPVVMTLSWAACHCPGAPAGGHQVRICWQAPGGRRCSEDWPLEHVGQPDPQAPGG